MRWGGKRARNDWTRPVEGWRRSSVQSRAHPRRLSIFSWMRACPSAPACRGKLLRSPSRRHTSHHRGPGRSQPCRGALLRPQRGNLVKRLSHRQSLRTRRRLLCQRRRLRHLPPAPRASATAGFMVGLPAITPPTCHSSPVPGAIARDPRNRCLPTRYQRLRGGGSSPATRTGTRRWRR